MTLSNTPFMKTLEIDHASLIPSKFSSSFTPRSVHEVSDRPSYIRAQLPLEILYLAQEYAAPREADLALGSLIPRNPAHEILDYILEVSFILDLNALFKEQNFPDDKVQALARLGPRVECIWDAKNFAFLGTTQHEDTATFVVLSTCDPPQYQPHKLELSSHNDLVIPAVSFDGRITVSGVRDCGFPMWSTDEGLAPM
ncbi:uncharacterized protein TRAVEDRAFT_50813 [Trametes versicolor FP-101664 SS1]|uniref:uncharacterized protein n=1 Tax=Trametes versicolor (strain FP-101664) TaxID=717944 RepID=UPI0004623F1F|nr:uncharacterized protein TRAVEDRAFT_50813 [Trametes versicolor FP-101664 SS1]EIW54673.1 hypothetical protein TRAVEDRAFT_50813 [Trametes versicolor FP-101664 SS1]